MTLFHCIEFDKVDQNTLAYLCSATPIVSIETTIQIAISLINNCGVQYPEDAAFYVIWIFKKLQKLFEDFKEDWYNLLSQIPLPVIKHVLMLRRDANSDALFLLQYSGASILELIPQKEYESIWYNFDCSKLSIDTLSRVAKSTNVPTVVRAKCIDILTEKAQPTVMDDSEEKRILLKHVNEKTSLLKEPMLTFVTTCHKFINDPSSFRDDNIYKFDKAVIEYVCVYNIENMKYLDTSLLKDKELMLKLISKNPFCVQYVSPTLLQDEDILTAASVNSSTLKTIKHVDELYETQMMLKICKLNVNHTNFFKWSNRVSKTSISSINMKVFDYLMQNNKSQDALIYLNIGRCYVNGLNVPKDMAVAYHWYLQSANLGNADAMKNVAYYYDVIGSEKNYAKAIEWYNKAIEAGSIGAMTNIGCLYETGEGVAKDLKTAKMYYSKAARMGEKLAATYLKQLEEQEQREKSLV